MGPHYDAAIRQQEVVARELARRKRPVPTRRARFGLPLIAGLLAGLALLPLLLIG